MPRSREDRIIPVAPIDRLIRKAAVSDKIRVSDKGSERLAKILEDVGTFLARRASEITEHSGRKTITDKDIDLVYKQWNKPM
jgi:histone H3/H4